MKFIVFNEEMNAGRSKTYKPQISRISWIGVEDREICGRLRGEACNLLRNLSKRVCVVR
jgi:hypothetical protein